MAKKKKKDDIEFEVGLDGTITKYNENKNRNSNNDIEFEVGLDGTITKNISTTPILKNKYSKKEEDKSLLNKIGDFGLKSLKTAGNFATNMGEGALRTGEGILDFSNSIVDRTTNALTEKAEVLTGISTNEEAKRHRQKNDEASRKFIKRDLTNEFQEKVGFKDIQKDWEKNSLITEENLGGQIAQGIGGMVPSLLVGQYTGLGEVANTSTKGMKLGKKMLTSAKNIGKQTVSNLGSTTVLGVGSYGQALQEAYQNGANDDEARKYALGSSATELATEWITGGIPGLEGTGVVDKTAKQLIDKSTGKIKGNVLKGIAKTIINAGYEIVGEGFEEGLSEIISPILKNATYSKDEKVNWNDVFNSALVGGITGGILNVPGTINDFKNNISLTNKTNSPQNLMPSVNTISNSNSKSVQENPLLQEKTAINMPSVVLNKNVEITNENNLENTTDYSTNINNSIDSNQEAFEFTKSDNLKINALRESASKYLNNSNDTKSFMEVAEKVIDDKNYNIVFDENLGTNTNTLVNAQIKTLENGETEIRINPNSERAGEFLLTHEITHAIETQEMVDLAKDYANKNEEFNNALNSLKETYNTNDVSSEVLADISGQLFGNQEFINNLSMKKPSIFKRIYDSIISLANKITGNSRESLFIKDLKNKWERAYRDNNNLLKNNEKSLFSRKKANNIKEILPDLVEEIKKKTISNIKSKENVKMVPIEELLKYKKNGGYRTSEDIIRLTNNIMANGIETPIEIARSNGNIEIYNGNHRLMIAEKLGLKEVPVKYIDNNIENNINSSYNNDINSYIEGEDNGNITRTAKFEKVDDKSRNNTRYSLTDSKQSNIERRIPRDGRLSDSLSGYNDGTSGNTAFGENYTSKKTEQGLNNSSFSFDENAKQYTNLNETEKIEFYTKENGDIKISLLDSNANIVNDFSAISERELKKQLGDEIGEYISNKSNNSVNSINLQHENNNTSVTEDYKMNHRPSEDYGNASNFERNMSDIFEHPEWYLDMTESYNKESLNALKKVRNNPEGDLKIYRATPGNKINLGDWVTPSKKYAEEHLERSLNGSGNIIEMTVKAKDVLFAGDDINEFGDFPENNKYSKSNGAWQEFVEKNFKTKGSRTNLNAIRNYSTNTEQRLINKKSDKIKEQFEKDKNKTKKYITKEASKILEFSDYKTKQKFTDLISEYYDNPNREKIKQDILENFSEKRIEYINDEFSDIKRQIRTTDLKVNEYVKRNMTDYNFFRKDNFSKLKLKKEGQSIDSFYAEMSEMYPNIFSKDITNEVDQLKRLSEFMSEDISIVEKYNLDDEVINKATDYIYNSLKNKENIDDLISSISISPKEIRKEKTSELRELASEFLENSSNWKDKKSGLAYKINTMKRNFYDIMGKRDASRLYENFIEPIFNHNSQMQEDISKYNDKISKLKLNENESIAVQMFGELKYNPETLVTQMQVDEFFEKNKLNYDKIAKSVEVFRTVYDELLERRNATLKEMGYKEVDYRKGYFPHFVENKPTSIFGKALEKMGWKFNDDSIPTSISGITDQFKPGKVWTSSSQQRKGKFTDYNALKGFDNYIRGAMNEIYFTEDIQKLRALENEIRYQHSDKGIQNKIDEIQSDNSLTFEEKQDKIDKVYTTYITPLNNFVSELRDYTNGLANKKSGLDRTVESLTNRKFYNTMSNISSRLSANMVGLNLGSAITNFIPITQAFSQVKSKYLLKGLKEAIKSQYSADGFESKSVFLTTRLNEAERLYKTKLEKISEKANFIFDGIDSITANTIVRGKYYENIAKGMTEFNAMRNADEFARDLMAGRGKGEMPTAFNSKNPIVKAFTAFQLETANQFGYMLKDLPRDLEDETKNKLVSAFIKMFFGAWIYNQLTEKVVGRKAAFSPADTIKEIYNTATDGDSKIKDKSSDILEKLTGDIPFVGGLVGGGRLPVSSVANPIKILKGESTIKDETKKALYYTVMPSGGGQLKKTVEGALLYKKSLNPFSKDFMKKREMPGSYNKKKELRFEAKKDPLSVTQNLLFGQYSSKNARNYFEHNYMPVSKETIKRLKKDNISISKYRDYEDKYNSLKNSKGDKLKEIKSDKDSEGKPISGSASAKKAYLIMKSDFSDKEKNYMLSKLSNFKNEDDVSMLKKLGDDQKNYNLYYSLSNQKKKEFISEIDNYRISVSQLTEFYNMRKNANKEYTSAKSKEVIMNYLSNSNLEDKTKWYLYSKDYGSDKLSKQIETFKIRSDDYFNIIKIKNDITQKYPGNKNSKKRKELIFNNINDLKLSKIQKVILFNQVGYSSKSGKEMVYNYVNNLHLSQSEKKALFESIY